MNFILQPICCQAINQQSIDFIQSKEKMKPLNFMLILAIILTIGTSLRVDPQSSLFIDQYNRTTIFHGVNTVYKVFPFYPDTQTYSSNYSLTDIDLYNLKHWGFNHIRLHAAWEGVEPVKGEYNYSYVEKLREIVRKCNKFGIQVLLDAHQDLFNRNFCGQGFPEWTGNRTSFPKPLKVDIRYDEKGYPLREDCLKIPFSEFYLSYDLMQFQQDFFANKDGLLDHFSKMWEIVATYMSNEPNLIGYEILNEPIGANAYKNVADVIQPGVSNNKYMLKAYKQMYRAIRAVDQKSLIFFEPSILDFLSEGFFQTPGGEEQASKQVFSYHVYCPLVTPMGEPVSTDFCKYFDQLEVASKQANIQHMKIGGFMTEYGALSDSTKSAKQITILTDLMQQYFRSWTYWQFKYYNDVTTMARPATTESFYNMDGSLQQNKVKALARPYTYAICGKPIKETFKNGVFTIKYFADRKCYNKNTEIFLSEAFYFQTGFEVNFSNSCKDCKLMLVPGEQSNFYQVIVPHESSFNRTIEITVSQKKKNEVNSLDS